VGIDGTPNELQNALSVGVSENSIPSIERRAASIKMQSALSARNDRNQLSFNPVMIQVVRIEQRAASRASV
jgi:hypothetical protein